VRLALVLLLVGFVASCHRAPPANPHYVLGDAYQADGVWYYPRESYEARETGLAIVYPAGHPDFTANGELFDQGAMAAAHQTLQLPAIVRLTNLENGRQALVRINDRGPATPHRLIEITRRTATLLAIPVDGTARVQLEVLSRESQAAVEAVPGAPKLQLTSAPIGDVRQSALPPPGSATPAQDAAVQQAASAPAPADVAAVLDTRLPETLTQAAPDPGNLYVLLGTFQGFRYANMQRARVGLGANVVSGSGNGAPTYRVIMGPFTTVPQADEALDQALRAGVTDARIVVE
jgi:rare lipoprotein A